MYSLEPPQQKHRLWYLLEPPRRGGSNEYHNLCFEQKYEEKKKNFLSENFKFLVVKFSVYLNRRVFVMDARQRSRGTDFSIYPHTNDRFFFSFFVFLST